jgi:hypothetical protein
MDERCESPSPYPASLKEQSKIAIDRNLIANRQNICLSSLLMELVWGGSLSPGHVSDDFWPVILGACSISPDFNRLRALQDSEFNKVFA